MTKENVKTIYWRQEAKSINLKWEDWVNMYNHYSNSSRCVSKCTRIEWCKGVSYRVDKVNSYVHLYVRDADNFKKYKTNYVDYYSNLYDDDRNTGKKVENQGEKHLKDTNDKFLERTGISLRKAFGYSDTELLVCVPKQLAYSNKRLMGRKLSHLSSIDGCSQYLSNCLGRLPDAHFTKVEEGYVKPTEEYPFAFYPDTGHCAEYGVFDTHEWVYHSLSNELFRDKDKWEQHPLDKDSKTILMKASSYELTPELKDIYARKKAGDSVAKEAYTRLIGQMHNTRQEKDKFQHIAAIAIGRSNQKILNYANRIGVCDIVQISVDGIIYNNCGVYGSDYKDTGVMFQEFTNKIGYVHSMNRYIISDGTKIIKERHSGCDIDKNGNPITIEGITDITDCTTWTRKVDVVDKLDNIIKKEIIYG